MDAVDPPPGETDERGEVLITCEPFRLESSHLAGRCRIALDGLAADARWSAVTDSSPSGEVLWIGNTDLRCAELLMTKIGGTARPAVYCAPSSTLKGVAYGSAFCGENGPAEGPPLFSHYFIRCGGRRGSMSGTFRYFRYLRRCVTHARNRPVSRGGETPQLALPRYPATPPWGCGAARAGRVSAVSATPLPLRLTPRRNAPGDRRATGSDRRCARPTECRCWRPGAP